MAGELAAEWIRIPDGNGNLRKVWIRDSQARRDIAQLQTDVSGLVIPDPSDASPQMDGTAAAGSSADYSRADHVHPSDTSKADAATTLAGYGITDAYTKTQVDGMIPSVPSAYTSNPEMDGTASPGSSTAWARGDHVHPHDSTKADVSAIPTKTSDLTNDSGFITSAPVTSVNGQTGAVMISVPTKTSDLTNDSGFLTSAPVASVNGQTGAVSLDASDVGALPDSTTIPSKTSQLTNDSGFLTSAPVTSVNTKTGAVSLTASDVGALPSSTAIPSKTSDLTNDSGFITSASVPTKTSDLTNDSGFITASAVPDPSSTAPAMDGTAAAGSSTDYARADHVHPSDTSKADVSAIPTATSQLTNDSDFITLGSTMFGKPTSIPASSDLDTYTTVGHYSANTGTTASSLSNCPTTSNFSLFVIWRTDSLKSQIIFTAGNTLFYRYQSSSGWSAWRKITTSAL